MSVELPTESTTIARDETPGFLPRARDAMSLAVSSSIMAASLALLATGAWLKERPEFWRHAGGYPRWLRELVGTMFYPWLAACLLGMLAWQVCVILRPARSRCGLAARFGLTAVLWGVFFCVLYMVVANNLENMIHGRALHAH